MQGGCNFQLQNCFGTLGKSFVSSEKTLGIVIIPLVLNILFYDPMCAHSWAGKENILLVCLYLSMCLTKLAYKKTDVRYARVPEYLYLYIMTTISS